MRVYVQLAPDKASLDHLHELQSTLPNQKSGRLLPPEELHITLIHFGDADDMFGFIQKSSDITRPTYNDLLEQYIDATENALPDTAFELKPSGVAGFGPTGKTLVVTYEPSDKLLYLHQQAVSKLESFLKACGVTDYKQFITTNQNLRHTYTFSPHLTLFKGYEGVIPELELRPIAVTAMNVRF